jgi:hypothetical protein
MGPGAVGRRLEGRTGISIGMKEEKGEYGELSRRNPMN